MKSAFLGILFVPSLVWGGNLEKSVKLCLSADAPLPAGVRVSSSIRKVPGKFGKAFLIEKRTVNSFAPANVVLTGNAVLTGKNNKLVLPSRAVAALPLTGLKVRSKNTLSFLYSGSGKVTVSLDDNIIAVFDAKAKNEKGAVTFEALADCHTLRISANQGAVLEQVMLDKGCILKLVLAFGLVFQIPLVLFILGWMGVITSETLISFRRFAIVIAFFLGMVLTPPDPMSQLIMAIPLCLFYELCIWGVKAKEVISAKSNKA